MIRIILLLLASVLFASPALAMRCGSRVVNDQMQDFQVRDRCGDPFYTDREIAVDIVGAYSAYEVQQPVRYDIWYYNFGPRQFMHKLVFREGILVRDERLGYGFDSVGDSCNPNGLFEGLSAGELYARCGEPASRRDDSATIVQRPARGVERVHDDRRERWIYDFGESRFVRAVTIDNGRVTGSESLER